MQTSSPPVITPNRSQSNPDDMITLPRPIQSVGINLHDVSGTSTGQTLPRKRRAPPGTHFCPTIWWVYPHLLLFLSSTHYCPLFHPLLSEISSSSCKDLARGSAGSKTPGVVTICGWSAAGRRPTPGLQQQLQGSCARVRRIQAPGVVTICGWSAAGRRPTPGLQQQLQGSCARVRRIQTPGVVTICRWSAAGRRPTRSAAVTDF